MNDIKALKDPYFRRKQGLDAADHPSGTTEMADEELQNVNAASTPVSVSIFVTVRVCSAAASVLLRSIQSGCHRHLGGR